VLWPCVCLSVTTQCSIRMAEWIQLVFGAEVTLRFSYVRNLIIAEIRVLLSGTFSHTLNLANFLLFHHGTSIVTNVVNLIRPLQLYNNNTICIAPIKSEDTDTEALGGAGLSPAKQM